MLKNSNKIWFFSFFFILIGCSHFRTIGNKQELLQHEIEKWNHFQIEGIVELNYKEFVFRKHFSAQKNETTFRFDVIDSGLFGVNPTPFLSLYIDSLVCIKKYPDYQLEKFPLPPTFASIDLTKIASDREKIIQKKQIKKNGFSLFFDDIMKINYFTANDLQVDFLYNHLNQIENIEVKKNGQIVAVLYIDKMTKGTNKIKPLR